MACPPLIAGLATVAASLAVVPMKASAEPLALATGAASVGREAFRYRLGPGDSLVMSVFKMSGYRRM